MNKLSAALFGLMAVSLAAPALAGPNWDVIREAESRHAAHKAEEHVEPLDHGPRAISTPWLNRMHAMHEGAAAHMVAANTTHN
jgi:hypothetical protein